MHAAHGANLCFTPDSLHKATACAVCAASCIQLYLGGWSDSNTGSTTEFLLAVID